MACIDFVTRLGVLWEIGNVLTLVLAVTRIDVRKLALRKREKAYKILEMFLQ